MGLGQEVVARARQLEHLGDFFATSPRLQADGQDLSFITVRIEDKHGNLCPRADNQVKFHVQGAGTIAAVGNGNPASLESFQADRIKAFSGQCLLIVQSDVERSGTINIKATASGLQGGHTIVTTDHTVVHLSNDR